MSFPDPPGISGTALGQPEAFNQSGRFEKHTIMETQYFEKDIECFSVRASSFPEGIKEAWNKRYGMLDHLEGRTFYGISRPEPTAKGAIAYWAATTETFPGEANKYGSEQFTIKKGYYLGHDLPDWQKDETQIGKIFRKMLTDPRIDPGGYCLEKYVGETDVQCLVLLDAMKSIRLSPDAAGL